MTKCKYYDCGWCYHPEPHLTNCNSSCACVAPQLCPVLLKQQSYKNDQLKTVNYESL